MKKLNRKDIDILKKLINPKAEKLKKGEAGSLLTSISRYYITDRDDFLCRLEKLPDKDLKYMAERAMDGSECLLCIAPQCAEIFLNTVERRLSPEISGRLRELFENVTTGYRDEILSTSTLESTK